MLKKLIRIAGFLVLFSSGMLLGHIPWSRANANWLVFIFSILYFLIMISFGSFLTNTTMFDN